jgi:hypothetical protein
MSGEIKLPDDVSHAIGKLTTQMAGIEFDMSFFISQLLGGYFEAGHAITSELGFRQLISVLSSLFKVKVKDDALFRQLRTLLAQIEKLETKRNKVVHSLWYFDEKTRTTRRMKVTAKYPKGVRYDFEDVSSASINSLTDELVVASRDLDDLMEKALDQVDTICLKNNAAG